MYSFIPIFQDWKILVILLQFNCFQNISYLSFIFQWMMKYFRNSSYLFIIVPKGWWNISEIVISSKLFLSLQNSSYLFIIVPKGWWNISKIVLISSELFLSLQNSSYLFRTVPTSSDHHFKLLRKAKTIWYRTENRRKKIIISICWRRQKSYDTVQRTGKKRSSFHIDEKAEMIWYSMEDRRKKIKRIWTWVK